MKPFLRLRSQIAASCSWFRAVMRRRHVEEDMAAELKSHLEYRTGDLVRGGMSPEEAARQARIELGSPLTHREGMRAALGLRWLDEFAADLRFAARLLRKEPGFTAIAVVSLALAIGANTAIFSVAKETLYDRLNVPHPEQLRILGWRSVGKSAVHGFRTEFDVSTAGMTSECFSYPVFRHLASTDHALSGLAAFEDLQSTVSVLGVSRPVMVQTVSGSYYQTLGVQPQLGRAIEMRDDGAPGSAPFAVISDAFWQRAFGRSPSVLGQTIRIRQTAFTIVGVNPQRFTGTSSVQESPELFVPMSMYDAVDSWAGVGSSPVTGNNFWALHVIGRLSDVRREGGARAALDVSLAAAVHATMAVKPGETMPHIVLADGARGLRRLDSVFRKPTTVLMVLVGLVLLLACANIASLLFARATEREREISVRLALGASRGRVLRQLLAESLLLASLGGALGLVVGYLARGGLPMLLMGQARFRVAPLQVRFDWGVFAFAASVTLATAVLFGLAPAWWGARSSVADGLKQGARSTTRARRGLGGKALVCVQIALSTILIVGAGLFVRTVYELRSLDPGFGGDHLLQVPVYPPPDRFPAKKNLPLMRAVEAALAAVPGAESVTAMSSPWLGSGWGTTDIRTEEELKHPYSTPVPKPAPHASGTSETSISGAENGPDWSERQEIVGNNFFPAMHVAILHGRGFGAQDTATSTHVAVINAALARRRFPHSNPVGQHFTMGDGSKPDWIEVVGVCADTLYDDLRTAAPPQFFLPYVQSNDLYGLVFMVRTPMPQARIDSNLRRAVASVNLDLPVDTIMSQQELTDQTMRPELVLSALTSGFGLLALALACVGIYGVMAYSVAQRTNEIGIRLALGAEPARVRRMILRESTVLTVAGIAVGVAGAVALARLVKSMLYGIAPYDPATLVGGVTLLLAVALAASWIPARRAASVEPMQALRHE